eukprot:scaffold43140_cov39-Prasinocladus_malaysianus.AAC.1
MAAALGSKSTAGGYSGARTNSNLRDRHRPAVAACRRGTYSLRVEARAGGGRGAGGRGNGGGRGGMREQPPPREGPPTQANINSKQKAKPLPEYGYFSEADPKGD